jgi:hypothetical protein
VFEQLFKVPELLAADGDHRTLEELVRVDEETNLPARTNVIKLFTAVIYEC